MRTKKEIDTEIAALQALKPIGQFKRKTEQTIKHAVTELQQGWDDTSGEYDELPPHDQDMIMQARRWKEGDTDDKPSEGWGALVEGQ